MSSDTLGTPVASPEALGIARRCLACGHELASRTHKYCLGGGVARRQELSTRGLTAMKERRLRLTPAEDKRQRRERGAKVSLRERLPVAERAVWAPLHRNSAEVPMTFVGLDLHQRDITASALDTGGQSTS